MLRWATILLSALGLAVGVWAVSTAHEPPVNLPLDRPASVNPFATGVAALGLVEPAGKDVGVYPPEPALVTAVLADVGDRVEKDQPLLQLDARLLRADLLRAKAAVEAAQAEIDRWHALPRAEDLPPLEAAVARAESVVKDREDVAARIREAVGKGSGNEREVVASRLALDTAQAELARARADLAKARAGGWTADLHVASALLAQKQAEVAALDLLIERMTVRAPRAGVVLRRSVEPGEFASPTRATPLLILGDLSNLAVRAQIDEEDIALVRRDSRAVARTRGAVVRDVPLRLVRIEPYARPKSDLLGTNAERVDTRVIDVLFEVTAAEGTALYPGQALDVFIDSGTGARP